MNTAEPLSPYMTAEEQRLAEENKRLRELLNDLHQYAQKHIRYWPISNQEIEIDTKVKKALEGHI